MPDTRVVVIYESIYGNTRAVAEAIAEGLAPLGGVEVRSVHDTDDSGADAADLLVVGGPTHMHGMTSSFSRKAAVQAGEEDGAEIEPGAGDGRGLRQWLGERSGNGRKAAAFDTRIDRSPALTGAASRSIARRLHGGGFELVADRESFFVEDSEGPLAEGELERARDWGARLARAMVDS
jgi:Flavodoxin